jgi:hypothetical protein
MIEPHPEALKFELLIVNRPVLCLTSNGTPSGRHRSRYH